MDAIGRARMREAFYREFLQALEEGNAALAVGAGLSIDAGLPSWRDLLRDAAEEIGLDVEKETDLVGLAQFHVNHRLNCNHLAQRIVNEYTKDVPLKNNHHLIAALPIDTIWTTNYDKLLEKGFREAHKRPDVKSTHEQMTTPLPRRDVVIYKMHGDVDHATQAVLTRDDYESYDQHRRLFTEALRVDLVRKKFLFVGFSFTDPNIDYILARIRVLLGERSQGHYCILKTPSSKEEDYQYECTKLQHRINDLKKYGIQTLLVEHYSEITEILRRLVRDVRRRDVFVSGSAHDLAPLGEARLNGFASLLGSELIKRGHNLVSGLGLGVAGAVVVGALGAIYSDDDAHLDERLRLRPFPQTPPNGMEREEFFTKWRTDIITSAGFTVFISGNKLGPDGKTVEPADGLREEFKLTKSFGRYPVPIGATGHVARELWEEVTASLDSFYPQGGVKDHFTVLGDEKQSNAALVKAVLAIIERASKS